MLPDVDAADVAHRVGYHLQLSAIDLGQFLVFDDETTVNEPSWNAFLAPGAQAGFLLGSASDSFVVGVDVHYAPALFGRARPAVRAGLFAAYYVPFLDLN